MKPLAAGTLLTLTVLASGTAFAQGSVANDAVGGAAKGALIGAIAGDAGKGRQPARSLASCSAA